jgi:sialate O-acetylesterase
MRTLLTRCALVALALTFATAAQADVKLPKIFSSNMVLQQKQPIKIWGWAEAGEKVTVDLDGQTATATTDDQGSWQAELPARKADGKQYTLTVSGKNEIKLTNILLGEVWLGSGQSNMEWTVKGAKDAGKEITAANHPQIRLFLVPKAKSPTPTKDIKGGTWQVCSPKTVGPFSATAYYFARALQKEINVPVGIIASSWGGTLIEPWTPKNGKGAVLYNAMIHPLAPLSISGVIWYQGESNVLSNTSHKYHDLKKQLIEDWRKAWGNDKISFYYVHIAPWAGRYGPGELPKLWESQTKSLTLPHTGMAVITDAVDNIKDIHPRNKQVVGHRLAQWALAKNYGKDVVYSGPLYKSMKVDGNKIQLTFAHADGLKARNDKDLNEFTVAGADGKFVPAKATIDGNTIVVQAASVAQPTQVRFGWHKTCNPNLVNGAGLPAAPFHTNGWQGGTGE